MWVLAIAEGPAKPTFVMTRWWAVSVALIGLLALAYAIHRVIRGTAPATDSGGTASEAAIAFRRRGIKSLVIGSDGRASTSKVQAFIWTAALLFALSFLLIWGRSIDCDGREARHNLCREAADARGVFDDVTRRGLQPEIYVLLGLPLAAAIAAKAMNNQKEDEGTLNKPRLEANKKGVLDGVAEVMSNDKGQADLVDFQYFGFNLLALGFFMTEFLTKPLAGLPTIPRTLLALSGLSAGTYTAKKAIERGEKPDDAATVEVPGDEASATSPKSAVAKAKSGARRRAR